MEIRSYLKDNILLFDGGMGTCYAARNNTAADACEWASLTNPGEIEAIHRAYREAGCQAIKTNTYAVNRLRMPESDCRALIRAACAIARRAADGAFVFGAIGPIPVQDDRDMNTEYRFVIDCFLELGISNFLFETHSTDLYLHEAAAYIREKNPEAFVLLSFNTQPDGFTAAGRLIRDLCRDGADDPNVDAVGMNCMTTARHMVDLLRKIGPLDKAISVMPNACYPTVRSGRSFYDGDPRYFASQMAVLRDEGARILGGCCGTTPEYTAATAKALKAPAHFRIPWPRSEEKAPVITRENPFWDVLCDPERKAIAVELDPPEDADMQRFMDRARELQSKDVDIITIADCPVARAKVDSSLAACKLHRELGVSALPHMTCRDRNLNATQALLLGLCAEGIGNVLVVTGDPIPSASRDEVKSVYNFNSRGLMQYIRGLNETVLPTPFHIFGALNVNARNFRVQLDLAKKKEECGCEGFLTQPVLSPQAAENLKLARQELKGKLLGGIMPVVSHRNALFMNSEIAGITVAESIIACYEGLDRTQAEALAVEISADFGREIAPYTDGYYLVTPFGRTGLIARILDRFREEGLI